MKVKRLLMLAIASTALLFVGCEKEEQNDNTNQNEPQTLSEMIIGKWECTKFDISHWGTATFSDPSASVGCKWNFKDDGTLITPSGVEVYSIIEGSAPKLKISGYKEFNMTLTSNYLRISHTQHTDNKIEGSEQSYSAEFTKIE